MTISNTLYFVIPERNRSGGVRVTVEMANRLVNRGIDARILILPASGLRQRLRRMRRSIARNADWVSGFHGRLDVARHGLRSMAFGHDDVVIAVGSYVAPFLGQVAKGPLLVRYCHGLHLFDGVRMAAAWRGEIPTLAVTEATAAILRNRLGTNVVAVVPNGIDCEKYYPEQSERNRVGTIYSTHEAKAPEDVVAFFRRLHATDPGIGTLAFGSGPKPADLVVDEYTQLPSLELARSLYSSAGVWVVLSRAEGLPGQVLEAMACGAAVVATNEPGSAALVHHGKNGLLVPVGDTERAIEAVSALMHDQKLRLAIVERGLETARSYSWERAVDLFIDAIEGVLVRRQTVGVV